MSILTTLLAPQAILVYEISITHELCAKDGPEDESYTKMALFMQNLQTSACTGDVRGRFCHEQECREQEQRGTSAFYTDATKLTTKRAPSTLGLDWIASTLVPCRLFLYRFRHNTATKNCIHLAQMAYCWIL